MNRAIRLARRCVIESTRESTRPRARCGSARRKVSTRIKRPRRGKASRLQDGARRGTTRSYATGCARWICQRSITAPVSPGDVDRINPLARVTARTSVSFSGHVARPRTGGPFCIRALPGVTSATYPLFSTRQGLRDHPRGTRVARSLERP